MPLSKGQEERVDELSHLRITKIALYPAEHNFFKILIMLNDHTHTTIDLEKTRYSDLNNQRPEVLTYYELLDGGLAVRWPMLDLTIPLKALL